MLKGKIKAVCLFEFGIAIVCAFGTTHVYAEMDSIAGQLSPELMRAIDSTPDATLFSVEAYAAVSSMYLFRGQDLGNGSAMVSGYVVGSSKGFYSGIWGASGDSELGTEYDVFFGYEGNIGDVTINTNLTNYIYPSNEDADTFGAVSDFYLNVTYALFAFDYQDNIAGDSGYAYYAFTASLFKYSVTLGMADIDDLSDNVALSNIPGDSNFAGDIRVDYTHLDFSYSHNENLTFTVSKVLQQDNVEVGGVKYENNVDDDLLFVVSYSLPIE